VSTCTWIVVEERAGRLPGVAQPLWPRANWWQTDVAAMGPAGPGASIQLVASPAGPFHVQDDAFSFGA
jgi:hypothetical protein